jgi:hypothetical protein
MLFEFCLSFFGGESLHRSTFLRHRVRRGVVTPQLTWCIYTKWISAPSHYFNAISKPVTLPGEDENSGRRKKAEIGSTLTAIVVPVE